MKDMNKDISYESAYSEVIEVLNYVSIDEYNKIPKKFITYLEENCDENSDFTYNIALPMDKQNLSDKAKNLLAVIYRLFWTNSDEKEKLNEADRFIEEENRKKYDLDNVFKNRQANKANVKSETKELVKYEKTKWYKKIFEKILKIFSKK